LDTDERIAEADALLREHGWQKTNDGWERRRGGYGFECIVQIDGTIYGYVGLHPPGTGISNIEVIAAAFARGK
jgi:hypothetical protein